MVCPCRRDSAPPPSNVASPNDLTYGACPPGAVTRNRSRARHVNVSLGEAEAVHLSTLLHQVVTESQADDRPAPRAPRIDVVRVTDDIAGELAEFFRAVWTPDATPNSVREGRAMTAARNPVERGADVPAAAVLRDGQVIGYLGTIPAKFWNGVTEIPGHWLKGFMVLPQHRNGPVGFAVLKETLRHIQLSALLTVAAPARRLFGAVGYIDCGILPNYVSLLRPARVARRLDMRALALGIPAWQERLIGWTQRFGFATVAGGIAVAVLGIWRWAARSSSRMHIDTSGKLPAKPDLDDLWMRARATLAAAPVRNGTFLSWRYDARPGGPYEAVSVRDKQGQLLGVGVLRKPSEQGDERLRGISVASLSDLLFRADDPTAGTAVLVGVERVARRLGADAVLCSASHPAVTTLLRARAFVRVPGNVHFMVRERPASANLPTSLEQWWVTRGDMSSDEVF